MSDMRVPVAHGQMWVGDVGADPADRGAWTYVGEVGRLPWDNPDADPLADIRAIHDAGRPVYGPDAATGLLTAVSVIDRVADFEAVICAVLGILRPRRGGTWLYCGYKPCGGEERRPSRWRHSGKAFARYLRHYRRWHQ